MTYVDVCCWLATTFDYSVPHVPTPCFQGDLLLTAGKDLLIKLWKLVSTHFWPVRRAGQAGCVLRA